MVNHLSPSISSAIFARKLKSDKTFALLDYLRLAREYSLNSEGCGLLLSLFHFHLRKT